MTNRGKLVLGGLLVLGSGLAATLFVLKAGNDPMNADCKTVREIMAESSSGVEQISTIAIDNAGDPKPALDAFEQRAVSMDKRANSVVDTTLREQARHLVELDRSIVGIWSRTVALPAPPGADRAETRATEDAFKRAYASYDEDHDKTWASLLDACENHD